MIADGDGELGPGLLPIPGRTLFVGTRESSFSWSKTEKKHTISTLRIMLGTTWRFMVGLTVMVRGCSTGSSSH
ncbi:MAG TPA: hypothetical protein VJY33_16635 [Isosphaeraceae bacterium]|nr:hypothetical protein [Isosphaeraceae bacterium]